MVNHDGKALNFATRHSTPIASSWLVGLERHGEGSVATHAVQFYEHDDFLAAVVADFAGAAIATRQASVLIATKPHADAILGRMRAASLPVDEALASGLLTILDAAQTLAAFMEGGVPDAKRFCATLEPVLESARRVSAHATIRTFGEMVDLLWNEGNAEGALRVEELWNELARRYAFSLLCSYSMRGFSRESDALWVQSICTHHAHVIPTESYTQANDGARMVEIALLQQRALALESEIEHRKELEQSLRDALAAAETANRAKSDFLAVMSHELRTPLNAIGGHVQLLELGLHGPINGPQRETLGRVQRSQRHLLALINDLLNFSRADAGRVDYELKEFPLAPLVDEVVSLLAPMLAAKELDCVTQVERAAGATPMVRADADKVHQILVNLLTNAIKFTPSGGHLRVECEADDAAGTVAVRVCDTGVGIPPAKLESIFEPFVQLGTKPLGQREGVGLGLAISRALARGMGGDLKAVSEPGSGSTLTLTIPRA